jgi:hypothetical protein
MMYKQIRTNDRDWDESLEGAKYIGQTPGCSCCSSWEKLTPENLREHIESLEADLSTARDILYEIS